MVTINETSYKDERLGFFTDQRKLVQKRYDRLEKQIKPDEPYLSERVQTLSDCGRELSFYNDVIEMLKNDVVPKRIYEVYTRLNDELEQELAAAYDKLDEVERKIAREIIYDLAKKLHTMLPFKAISSINGEPMCNSFDLGKERTIYDILNYLGELEKKYEIM